MREEAYFSLGCFWGAQKLFQQQEGVLETYVGYMGGDKENPTYEEVCTGATGHAETVKVVFDPNIVTYEQLLKLFYAHHNPTSLNRQGADIGTQYRSALFPLNASQYRQAQETTAALAPAIMELYGAEAVTEINFSAPLPEFYLAEEYHQNYLLKNPQGYCSIKANGLSCQI